MGRRYRLRGAPPLLEGVVRPPRMATGREPPLSFPLPIYSAPEVFMKPRVVPHNHRPQARAYGNGRSEMRLLSSMYLAGVWL